MKRSVTFNCAGLEITGYEGAPLPIDKMAELVLSSDVHPIGFLTVGYEQGPQNYAVIEVRR